MKKLILLISSFVLIVTTPTISIASDSIIDVESVSSAATVSRISGSIVSESGSPLEFSTVIISGVSNPKFNKGEIADENGNFSIEVPKGRYNIEVSYLGYTSYTGTIEVDSNGKSLNKITLKNSSLQVDNVVVRGNSITQKADGYTLNLAGSKVTVGRNSLEVLNFAPGIVVDKDGVITVNGKSGTMIIVNNRVLNMSGNELKSYLESINAEDIKSVEVVTSAGAKYDASTTGGVLKITLRSGAIQGVSGTASISGRINNKDVNTINPSVSLNYGRKNLSLYGNVGYRNSSWGQDGVETTVYKSTNKNTVVNDAHILSRNKNYDARLGATYDLKERHFFGFEFSTYQSPKNTAETNTNAIEIGTNTPLNTLSSYNLIDKGRNYTGSLNYKYTLDSLGSNIFVVADYANSNSKSRGESVVNYRPFEGGYIQTIERDSLNRDNNIYSARVEYTQYFGSKFQLELGSKYYNSDMSTSLRYRGLQGNDWVINTNRSDEYTYKEDIIAGYANFSATLNRFSINAGLRVENTHTTPHSFVRPDVEMSKRYTDFFPSADIMYNINKDKGYSITASYRRTIWRPGFSMLNPSRIPINSNTFIEGNPNLKPVYSNNASLRFVLANKYSISLDFNDTKDYISQIIMLDPNDKDIMLYKHMNVERQTNYKINVNVPINVFKWWQMNIYANGGYDINNILGETDKRLAAYARMNNVYTMPKGWGAELNGYYGSSQMQGNVDISGMGSVDVVLRKNLLNNRLTITAQVNDIFNTLSFTSTTYGSEFAKLLSFQNHTRRFALAVRYNFKSGKQMKIRKTESNGSDERL